MNYGFEEKQKLGLRLKCERKRKKANGSEAANNYIVWLLKLQSG